MITSVEVNTLNIGMTIAPFNPDSKTTINTKIRMNLTRVGRSMLESVKAFTLPRPRSIALENLLNKFSGMINEAIKIYISSILSVKTYS